MVQSTWHRLHCDIYEATGFCLHLKKLRAILKHKHRQHSYLYNATLFVSFVSAKWVHADLSVPLMASIYALIGISGSMSHNYN